MKPIDRVPENSRLTFVRQTVVSDYKNKVGARAIYRCVCGVHKEILMAPVIYGKTLSCGCLLSELATTRSTKHGYYKHPLYRVWAKIKSRCYDRSAKEYINYGGRGVTMCDEWRDNPKSFVEWGTENGYAKGLDIDKDILPKSQGRSGMEYSPENCIFVSRKTNLRNRRNNVFLEYKGERLTVGEWAERLSIRPNLLYSRLKRYGWPVERAIEEPINIECRKSTYKN